MAFRLVSLELMWLWRQGCHYEHHVTVVVKLIVGVSTWEAKPPAPQIVKFPLSVNAVHFLIGSSWLSILSFKFWGAREIDDRLRVTCSEHLSATHCGRFPHSSIIPQQPQGVPLNDRSTVVRRARGHGLVRLSALRIFEKLKNHSNPHSWVCSLKTVNLQ